MAAIAFNEPDRLSKVFVEPRVPSSVIRGGVVIAGETSALSRARQQEQMNGSH